MGSLRFVPGGLVDDFDRAAARFSFLAEASRVLSSALTDKDCFSKLVHLSVPYLADWCTLVLVDERKGMNRVATAHVNPAKARLLARLEGRFPPDPDAPIGIPFAIRTGRSELVGQDGVGRAVERYSQNAALTEVVRQIGIRSYITVPLKTEGKVLGALWLVTSDSGRVLDQEDLRLAGELATRAAWSVFHLERYARAKRAYERCMLEGILRENFLTHLRHDVRSILTAGRLSAEMLRLKKNDPKTIDLLTRRILDSIDRVSRITEATRRSPMRIAR